jgi:hypothetical protein
MGALKPDLLRNTTMDLSVPRDIRHRRLLTVTGIAYTLSWIAGLAVAAPSPKLTASGASITAALAGHQAAVVLQFGLTEGLPAAGLAILGLAGATSGVLPRWLRYAGITLAIAITSSAVAYLLLLPGLAGLAYVSGPLLLLSSPAPVSRWLESPPWAVR